MEVSTWLTPAVRAALALALVVGAQAAAPATVRGLCGVLPAVVQPVDPAAVVEPSASRSSQHPVAWLAPRSE